MLPGSNGSTDNQRAPCYERPSVDRRDPGPVVAGPAPVGDPEVVVPHRPGLGAGRQRMAFVHLQPLQRFHVAYHAARFAWPDVELATLVAVEPGSPVGVADSG